MDLGLAQQLAQTWVMALVYWKLSRWGGSHGPTDVSSTNASPVNVPLLLLTCYFALQRIVFVWPTGLSLMNGCIQPLEISPKKHCIAWEYLSSSSGVNMQAIEGWIHEKCLGCYFRIAFKVLFLVLEHYKFSLHPFHGCLATTCRLYCMLICRLASYSHERSH